MKKKKLRAQIEKLWAAWVECQEGAKVDQVEIKRLEARVKELEAELIQAKETQRIYIGTPEQWRSYTLVT